MSRFSLEGRDGDIANVRNDGRLETQGLQHDAFLHATLKGDAYSVLTEVTLSDALLTTMSFLESLDDIIISGKDRMVIVESLEISADANIHIELFLGEAYTSGGTAKTPMSLHRGKTAKTAKVSVIDASTVPMVMGVAGTEMQSLFIGANTVVRHNVGIVLAKNSTISVKAQGALNNRVRVEMRFYTVAL